MKKRVFISYKSEDLSKRLAKQLEEYLRRQGYEVFLDTERLKAQTGQEWAKAIFQELRQTHVLIVLLEQETAGSDWVQREVDIARGLQVSIYPLVIDVVNAADAREKLAIDPLQYDTYEDSEKWRSNFLKTLEILISRTRDEQKALIQNIANKNRATKASDIKQYQAYRLRDHDHPATIYLATGDMLSVHNVDVMVNSENNYLQMARAFETDTISGTLRFMGSKRQAGDRILEDTVQIELDQQVEAEGGRPLGMGQVLPTHAGHVESELQKEAGARYIFHVSTVRVRQEDIQKLQPITDDSTITQAVIRCLNQIRKINSEQGVISPAGTPQHDAEIAIRDAGTFAPVRTIVFPLFGTGHGGRSAYEVIPPMLAGFEEFLRNRDADQQIAEIYLCAYTQDDRDAAIVEMTKQFAQV